MNVKCVKNINFVILCFERIFNLKIDEIRDDVLGEYNVIDIFQRSPERFSFRKVLFKC